MSHERSIDHVVLERGEIANSWRRERWDSLRLLTPNWQSRLPGYQYDGSDPDGYMTMREVIDFISRFAVLSSAPVRTHTTVTRVQRTDAGYDVATTNGDLRCRTIMIASGACNVSERSGDRQGRAGIDPVLHAIQLPQPERLAGRRRAGRRRIGYRRPTRRRNRPFRSAGHAVRRRARQAAADVSRPRRALVDGCVGRVESALQRNRRPDACPPPPVTATDRNA